MERGSYSRSSLPLVVEEKVTLEQQWDDLDQGTTNIKQRFSPAAAAAPLCNMQCTAVWNAATDTEFIASDSINTLNDATSLLLEKINVFVYA